MSFGNDDNIFRALQQFIDQHGDEFESIEKAVETFMSFYNNGELENEIESTPEMESAELFELSMSIGDEKQRKALLREAIELWPENWNAHLELIEGSLVEQIEQIRKLEITAFHKWEETDQVGWINYEERPYLRLKFMLAVILFKQGLLEEALEHFENLYEIDEMDSLGARYYIMSIYCRTYDFESAYELFSEVPYPASEDDRMIIPLLVVAVLTNNLTYAKDLFLDLEEANDNLFQLFMDDSWPMDLILGFGEADHFQMNSFESIAVALNDILPVVVSSEYLFDWMLEEYEAAEPHERVNVNEKVISFTGASKQYRAQTNQFTYKSYLEIPALADVVHIAAVTLQEMGHVKVEDFSAYTEKELLAIKHIGPQTIKQLKANGVKFKKK